MKYNILYVEDEQILGQLVTEALCKMGYDVCHLKSGVNALKVFREVPTHLCLLDITLPGTNGYELAAQIRLLDSKVPIIFLTAKIQVSDVLAGFKTGCNDYIRKPFSLDELGARISSWLHEKYGENASHELVVYKAGLYQFTPNDQLLATPTDNIQLTYKETIILTTLFAHRHQVVSRNHLMQKVWNSETIYNSRSLDVYINRLRKYFGGSGNRIMTLRGVGYKFITEQHN